MMPREQGTPPHEQVTIKDASPARSAGSWPPPPRNVRRQTLPAGMVILITLLALILIVSGLGFIIYTTTVQYSSNLHTQATAEAQSTATTLEQTRQVLQATANTLSTAQANIDATATAQEVETATTIAGVDQVTATASALQDMLTQDTSGTPALNDTLSDNSSHNGWDKGINSAGNTGCEFKAGAYHASEAQLGYLQPCMAETTNFSNFVYQVQMTIDAGSEGGIVFRANAPQGQYYLFRIGIDGSYTLEAYNNNKVKTLSSGISLAIVTGVSQSNNIAVIANKSSIYLYANQQFIASVADSTFQSGQIGVVALDYSTPTEVEFSNAQVWRL